MKIRAVVNLMLSRGFVGAGSEIDIDDASAERLALCGAAVVVDAFAGASIDEPVAPHDEQPAEAKKKRKK